MRLILCILTALAVITSGFWAYRENYATQAALDRVETLQRDIGTARARLAVLDAEWAYLNRPDRLRDLAQLNFDRLGLMALQAMHFARPTDIGLNGGLNGAPGVAGLRITDAQPTSSSGGQTGAQTGGGQP